MITSGGYNISLQGSFLSVTYIGLAAARLFLKLLPGSLGSTLGERERERDAKLCLPYRDVAPHCPLKDRHSASASASKPKPTEWWSSWSNASLAPTIRHKKRDRLSWPLSLSVTQKIPSPRRKGGGNTSTGHPEKVCIFC